MARIRERRKSNERQFLDEVEALATRLTTVRKPWSLRRARRAFERSYVEYMIRRAGHVRLDAADDLDISLSSLKVKLKLSRR